MYQTDPQQVIHELKVNKYRLPRPDNCPEVIYEVMNSCWNHNPELRPNFSTILTQISTYFTTEFSMKYESPDQNNFHENLVMQGGDGFGYVAKLLKIENLTLY